MKLYRYIIAIFSLIPLLLSCTDEVRYGNEFYEEDGIPVEFLFNLPEEPITRAIDNPKVVFNPGDVIHIQGTFNVKDNDGNESIVERYGAMRRNSSGWEAVEGNKLTWPSLSVSGVFKAYWISGSTSILYHGGEMLTRSLSDLTSNTDPLYASAGTAKKAIPYGHAVGLNFQHICAYLTLEEIEPMVSNSYWFTAEKNSSTPINNSFSLSLEADNKLKFEFSAVPDNDVGGLVYISGKAVNVENEYTGKILTHANYFLEPRIYDSFMVCYPGGINKYNEYLSYDFNSIPDNVGGADTPNVRPDLKAGNTYVLNVTKSPGVTIEQKPTPEGWDEAGFSYDIDVEEFLKAIFDGKEYRNKDNVKILESTPTGTKLLHNVDFNFEKYYIFEDDFSPNVNLGQIFDGDYHYICNIGCGVFRYNFGTIQNLGIKNIDAVLISDEDSDTGHDLSRQGLICGFNQKTGLIQNIHIDGSEKGDISGQVKNEKNGETHNLGCVVGSNIGNISDVAIYGTFNFTIEAYTEGDFTENVNATVNIGGIAGQNAGTGDITNVTSSDNNLRININNKLKGEIGAYYVGGITGYNTGYLDNIILTNINIDCSQSKGITLYTGGVAGEITVTTSADDGGGTSTDETAASVNYCRVGGSIKAGSASPSLAYPSLSPAVYTGGISGALSNVPVSETSTSCAVYGTQTEAEVSGVVYATGGAFGRIRVSTPLANLVAYGSMLQGPAKYIGTFAGIVPTGESWVKDYADKNIIINNNFSGINPIGIDLSI